MTNRRGAQVDTVVLAFMIADIRGYSRFSRERGDASAAALAKHFADLARDAVEARGGTVVELRGDEAFAAFPTAAEAVQAAVELQLTCTEETERDATLPLLVGIGIDVGPAVPVEDGYRGIAINLAARLCSAAGAGQVLLSATAAELSARVADDIEFRPHGTSTFKGFDEPVDVVEARSRCSPAPIVDTAHTSSLPPELVDQFPLVGRTHELRWLRGTWRQVRRSRGRVLVVSGPAGIGKTRLASELAAHVQQYGATRYAGPGGLATATALSALAEARTAETPTLVVIDHVDVIGHDAVETIVRAAVEIATKPVLILLLLRDLAAVPSLSELVDSNVVTDAHRRLPALSAADIADIVGLYAGEAATEAPIEMIVRASRGVPALVHEQAGGWAQSETTRRLEAAASFMAAARDRRSSDLEFANNVIGLKLGRLYAPEESSAAHGLDALGPYKGLASFGADDAAWFFGREQIVGELAARTVGSGALAVLGASGSGKSSVVAAGLLPSLRAGLLPGSERWRQASLRPGGMPMAALREALASQADDPIAVATAELGEGGRLVLVVDQFEEVFTACEEDAERRDFLAALSAHATMQPDRFVVVATLRSDYYGRLAEHPALAALFADNHILLGPLTRAELHRVVQLPAQRAGVRIEAALIDALVDEAAPEPGALPLLSTALVELWQARSSGWIRIAAYHEGGGIRGAVARLADASYAQLDEADRVAAKRVLLRLASSAEGDAATRRRVELDEFDLHRDVSARHVIDRFTADRLLTVSGTTVEVAHEALLREWPRLRGWLEEDVQGRHLRQHLTVAARGWDGVGRERAELYRGARLSAALEWSSEHPTELNDLERAFLTASREASEQEATRARQANRRLRALLAGAVALLLVAVAAGVVALVQRASAQRASTSALADSLGAQAVSQPRLDRAMLLAREAVALHTADRTRSELLSTLLRAPSVLRTFHVNVNRLNGIALSPDATLLALADNDNHVVVEDAATGHVIRRLATAGNFVAFAPNGDLLRLPPNPKVFVGLQRLAARTGAVLGTWRFADSVLRRATVLRSTNPGLPAFVTNPPFAFAPDGHSAVVSMFAKATDAPDNFVFRLSYPDGRLIGPMIKVPNTGDFPDVNYADHGRDIVTHDASHLSVFDAASGRVVHSYAATIEGAETVSVDGNNLAYARPDGSVSFLDLRTGRTRPGIGVVPSGISAMTFAEHDRVLVTGGLNGALQLWNVADRHVMQSLPGHAANIVGIAVSPDAATLYTASFDNIGIAWDLTGHRGAVPAFSAITTDPTFGAFSIAVSADNRTIAVGSASGRVALRDARTFALVATLPAGAGPIAAVDWSPDGAHLMVAETAVSPTHELGGSSLRIYDVRNRRAPHLLRTLASPLPGINWATFTRDGSAVVACGVAPSGAPHSAAGAIIESRVSDGRLVAAPTYLDKGLPVFVAPGATADRVVVSGWSASYELVDPRHRKVIAQTGGLGELIPGDAYSPDGSTVASVTFEGKLVLSDAYTGRTERVVQLVAEPLAAVAYSPDGRMLATVDTSDNTRLYDAKTLRQIGTTYTPPWAQAASASGGIDFSYAEFAPDGRHLYISNQNAQVWVLPTSVDLWIADACHIANRSFTRVEWSQFVPGRSYQPSCSQPG